MTLPALWAALVLLGSAPGPCTAPPPQAEASPQPVLARAYLAVAEEEWASGARAEAALAFRRAWEAEPANARARAGLAVSCAQSQGAALDSALARMRAGAWEEAADGLSLLRKGEDGAELALLEGICRLELGQQAQARALLERARNEAELTEEAELFLAVLALRSGQQEEASQRLGALAAGGGALAPTARALQRPEAGSSRLLLQAGLRALADSNVVLAPDTALSPTGNADGALQLEVTGWWRPLGQGGPYLALQGVRRWQQALTSYDSGALEALVGWQLERRGLQLGAEYALGVMLFGGALYQWSHQLTARAGLPLAGMLGRLEYGARLQEFPGADTAVFSGLRQQWRAGLEVQPLDSLLLEAGYGLALEGAQQLALSALAHGPLMQVRWQPLPSVRVLALGGLRLRQFDAVDPELGLQREERQWEGQLQVELDAARSWTLLATGELVRARANLASLSYVRLAGGLGVRALLEVR